MASPKSTRRAKSSATAVRVLAEEAVLDLTFVRERLARLELLPELLRDHTEQDAHQFASISGKLDLINDAVVSLHTQQEVAKAVAGLEARGTSRRWGSAAGAAAAGAGYVIGKLTGLL